MATRSPAVAKQACYMAGGLYLLIGLVPLVIALAGRHLPLPGWEGDNFLPVLVMETLPPAFALLFLAALVSAILSTVSANVLAISSVFTLNLMAGRLKSMTQAQQLWAGRTATVIAGLVALLFAASGTSIYNLLLLSIVLGQGGLLVAVLMGLYTPLGGPLSGVSAILANMACNLVTLIIWPLAMLEAPGVGLFDRLVMIIDGEAPSVPGTFLLSLAASAIAYVLAGFARPRAKALAA
jgi:Na+/proline symporter